MPQLQYRHVECSNVLSSHMLYVYFLHIYTCLLTSLNVSVFYVHATKPCNVLSCIIQPHPLQLRADFPRAIYTSSGHAMYSCLGLLLVEGHVAPGGLLQVQPVVLHVVHLQERGTVRRSPTKKGDCTQFTYNNVGLDVGHLQQRETARSLPTTNRNCEQFTYNKGGLHVVHLQQWGTAHSSPITKGDCTLFTYNKEGLHVVHLEQRGAAHSSPTTKRDCTQFTYNNGGLHIVHLQQRGTARSSHRTKGECTQFT